MLPSLNDSISESDWLAGLHHLFDNSILLAADPSTRKLLAFARALALSGAAACLDCHVDCSRTYHRSLAARCAVCKFMELGSRCILFWRRILALFAIEEAFQR